MMNEYIEKVFNIADGSNVKGCVRALVDGFDKGIDKRRRSKRKQGSK
jgi:hypothetical protein